jgi:hypothetical protein
MLFDYCYLIVLGLELLPLEIRQAQDISAAKLKTPNDPAIIPSQRSETADYPDRLTSRTHHRLHH